MNTAHDIQALLTARHLTLSTAESCTGGRVAAAITAVAGSSAYFQGALVAYQNEVKERLLGVDAGLIEQKGVVSREVVEAMVEGACSLFSTDFAIATTGCAGPGGGTESAPVGTIWIGCGRRGHVETTCLHTDHGREQNVEHATQAALQLMLDYLCREISPFAAEQAVYLA